VHLRRSWKLALSVFAVLGVAAMFASCGNDKGTGPKAGPEATGDPVLVGTWVAGYIGGALDPSGNPMHFVDGTTSTLVLQSNGHYSWFLHAQPWYNMNGTGTYTVDGDSIRLTGVLVDVCGSSIPYPQRKDLLEFEDEDGDVWAFVKQYADPNGHHPGPCVEEKISPLGSNGRAVFTYEDTLLVSKSSDINGDGIDENLITYVYDAQGRLLTELVDNGHPPNGTIDSRVTCTYDGSGRLVSRAKDSNNDGTIESIESYGYDANGNQTLIEQDTNADGTVDSRAQLTFDANGHKVSGTADWDMDGFIDERVWYAYDSAGNLRWQALSFFSGMYSGMYQATRMIYDSANNLILTINDIDDDNEIELFIFCGYDCFDQAP
jgi:hypothetical protein